MSMPAQTEPTLFKITEEDLSPNRTAHKQDKDCSICAASLGRKLGVLASKHHFCHFCYRGVCTRCSGHKVLHPETMRLQRCCNMCYTKFLAISIQAEKEAEIAQITEESKVIEGELQRAESERVDEDRKRTDLEAQVARLKNELLRNESQFLSQKSTLEKEIEDTAKENSILLSTVQSLESELESAQREFAQAEADMQTVTFELANCNVKANELKSLLLTQQHENEQIKRNLDAKLSALPTAAVDSAASKRQTRIDELKSAIEVANQRQYQLQQEQIDLIHKAEQAQKRLRERETMLEQAQDAREMRVSTAASELDVRKLAIATELKEKILSLRDENERLRREIEEKATATGESAETNTRKGEFGPQRTAACPNCNIF